MNLVGTGLVDRLKFEFTIEYEYESKIIDILKTDPAVGGLRRPRRILQPMPTRLR